MTVRIRVCVLELPAPDSSGYTWDPKGSGELLELRWFRNVAPLLDYVQTWGERVDALLFVLPTGVLWDAVAASRQLCQLGLLWPTVVLVILESGQGIPTELQPYIDEKQSFYHSATVLRVIDRDQVASVQTELEPLIQQAIARFVHQAPTCELPDYSTAQGASVETVRHQQQRLADKLRERLGYLGVYYQRDPRRFYRHLSSTERQMVMQRLRGLYQAIILDYFQAPQKANLRIDEFASLAFFNDLSVSHVLELHMSLMDDFAKQLKLEGRSEEILLDYRITLIDVIAHLAELYRRSILKEKL